MSALGSIKNVISHVRGPLSVSHLSHFRTEYLGVEGHFPTESGPDLPQHRGTLSGNVSHFRTEYLGVEGHFLTESGPNLPQHRGTLSGNDSNDSQKVVPWHETSHF